MSVTVHGAAVVASRQERRDGERGLLVLVPAGRAAWPRRLVAGCLVHAQLVSSWRASLGVAVVGAVQPFAVGEDSRWRGIARSRSPISW